MILKDTNYNKLGKKYLSIFLHNINISLLTTPQKDMNQII